MDSLIFRVFTRGSFSQDSREEVQSEPSVIKIQIDPAGLAEDIISVKNQEQSQGHFKRFVGRFIPNKKLKSSPELIETATGFRTATHQWRGVNPKPWCILEGYHVFDSAHSEPATTIIRYMRKELAELAGQSNLLWSRTVRRLQLDGDHDGVLRGIQWSSF